MAKKSSPRRRRKADAVPTDPEAERQAAQPATRVYPYDLPPLRNGDWTDFKTAERKLSDGIRKQSYTIYAGPQDGEERERFDKAVSRERFPAIAKRHGACEVWMRHFPEAIGAWVYAVRENPEDTPEPPIPFRAVPDIPLASATPHATPLECEMAEAQLMIDGIEQVRVSEADHLADNLNLEQWQRDELKRLLELSFFHPSETVAFRLGYAVARAEAMLKSEYLRDGLSLEESRRRGGEGKTERVSDDLIISDEQLARMYAAVKAKHPHLKRPDLLRKMLPLMKDSELMREQYPGLKKYKSERTLRDRLKNMGL